MTSVFAINFILRRDTAACQKSGTASKNAPDSHATSARETALRNCPDAPNIGDNDLNGNTNFSLKLGQITFAV